jgi:hypothetical protein
MVWTPYTQYYLMVALAYKSRNSEFDWILNVQSNNLITNFPPSVAEVDWLITKIRSSIDPIFLTKEILLTYYAVCRIPVHGMRVGVD